MSDWGQGASNNDIGWGQGAVNNDIGWGSIHELSWAGDTDIVGGGGFDADYQSILDYGTTQGYTLPSASQQLLQNQLVVDLKNAGIWSKLDTFGVFATDGDSDFALIDWKRVADYTAINSPTFTTDEGFAGNGTSSFIDTNFNPNTAVGSFNFKLNDASFGVYIKKVITSNTFVFGSYADTIRMRNQSSSSQRINSGDLNSSVLFQGVGLRSSNRTSAIDYVGFADLTRFDRIYAISNNTNDKLIILSGVDNTLFSNATISVAYAGASLVAEHTDFYNSLNTYITSL
jgi:hypothetical protein